MNDSRTALELAEDAWGAPEPGYGARLAAIRAAAADDGVSVVVDLHGALVDLRFDRWALDKPPGELAGLVRRLASEAGADALRQGRELLGDLLPEEAEPAARSDRPPEPDDDSLVPATWATWS
ncbi:hypothetical protein AB0M80_39480 [Amycolatopsis sp. NPDC051045]|uniref:hypothetical protein n=1 Tax=Amycolatopsis sp. NPDC051045 TaxID=3156922 RepID=UPI00341335A9